MNTWNTKSKRVEKDIDPEQEAFDKQKHLLKREVLKLKPGTFILIKWLGSPNTVAMILEKPTYEKGDMSVKVFHQGDNLRRGYYSITNDQVVKVLGQIQWPNAA